MTSAPRSNANLIEEEIAFWRGFIEWWARDREDPVPARAWEALAYAERKRSSGEGVNTVN
jgi:hypothetical protein